MAAGSISGVYWALLSRWVISSMVMGSRFKAGIPQPDGKGLLKQS